jgi:hypothetical protein
MCQVTLTSVVHGGPSFIIGPKHAETAVAQPGKSLRAKVTAPGKAMLKMVRTGWETTGGQTRTVSPIRFNQNHAL